MSRSKRAAQEAAPAEKKSILCLSDGRLRTGWLLAASLVCYAAAALGIRYALGRAFAGLFALWGIDGHNVALAPGWARFIYIWQGSIIAVVVSLLMLPLCRFLRGLWLPGSPAPGFGGRALAESALTGVSLAVLVAALSLIPDSSRLAWSLARPRLSWGLIGLCAVSLLTTLAEEAFGKAVLYDGIRLRHGRLWAIAAACALSLAANGPYGWTAIRAVNGLLLALVCCLVYERWGLWASTGLRWGFSASCALLLGFGGGESGVYRLYGVSETLLTGGDGGPVYGLWLALLLAGILAYLLFNQKQTD